MSNKKRKSLLKKYNIYKRPFGDKSAFNKESELSKSIREEWEAEKAKARARGEKVSTPIEEFSNESSGKVNIDENYKELLEDTLVDYSNDVVQSSVELFFYSSSSNNKQLKRYYQALAYDEDGSDKKYVYGMDCNPCCVMYFLQSYGLIPLKITRKQFEYIFTPLNPKKATAAKEGLSTPKNPNRYSYYNKNLNPVETLFDNISAFPKGGEAFLRGQIKGGAVFPHLSSASKVLQEICDRFYKLSLQQGYKVLQKSIKKNGTYYSLSYEKVKNKYQDLVKGNLGKDYFKKHVIFIGLAHYEPLPGHYCLIVDKPHPERKNGIDFWVYPADAPLYGNTHIFVPRTSRQSLKHLREIVYNPSSGHFLIYPNCAIGV